ncbi:helix-turn-helix domain-containing protein, partial [Streptococcus sp.]|uniref:helix-turn-helix domain-containing protein n=1 Tax=Streptococcus sp. TaxID=1306 RepID=UPI0025EC0D73
IYLRGIFMSRRERFTPYEKEQACLDYINGNRSSAEICNCLHISTRTIQDWAAIYKKHGILGLTKKTKNRSYSKEFKMELVKKYISGEASSVDLAHQYDISSGLLRNWIRMYNANIELKDYNPKQEVYMAKARRKTTIDERKEIVNYCIEHNRNYKETAALYNVSYSQVYSWMKKYDSDGEEGLIDKRGHHKLDDEVDELERLRRENVRLKRQLEKKDMTVELLKKVKEFGRM